MSALLEEDCWPEYWASEVYRKQMQVRLVLGQRVEVLCVDDVGDLDHQSPRYVRYGTVLAIIGDEAVVETDEGWLLMGKSMQFMPTP